jgi:Ca2+-binding EF-hand superfamily protein
MRDNDYFFFRRTVVKTNWMLTRVLAAMALIGTILGASAAFGQKTSSSPSGAKVWLTAMDTNHDGTVSKEEFTAYMASQFDKADADHDGTVDKNEMEQLRKMLGITNASAQKTSTGASSGPKLSLTALDKDNDGTVSKQEFTDYMGAQFDKADPDHDGTLDKKELEQLRKNLGIATNQCSFPFRL